MYKPTLFALEKLYEKVSKGGIILLDDYGKVFGATKATKDFFKKRNIKLKIELQNLSKLKFIIKDEARNKYILKNPPFIVAEISANQQQQFKKDLNL